MSFIGKWIAIYVFERKITDWQNRERQYWRTHINFGCDGHITKIATKIRSAASTFRYVKDSVLYGKKDHWETSHEAVARNAGDCDGYSIYVWHQLMKSGYDPNCLGMVVFDGHMSASFIYNGDIYIIDNGYLTDAVYKLRLLKERLKAKKMRPLLWFNLDTVRRL